MELRVHKDEGHPASESGSHQALREQQPAPVVTTSGEDSRRAEAAMALQSLSLLREGRSAGVEPVPETQPVSEPGNSSATLEISKSLVQVKRLGHRFPTTKLVDPNDSTLTMERTVE